MSDFIIRFCTVALVLCVVVFIGLLITAAWIFNMWFGVGVLALIMVSAFIAWIGKDW